MAQVADSLTAGREAAGRYAWSDALALFAAADADGGLSAPDLERLAESAWWMGRMRDCIAARERAHAAYLAAGDTRSAARVALGLADNHGDLLEVNVAGAWLQRAAKLLEGAAPCSETAMLALASSHGARVSGDREAAVEYAKEAVEHATQTGDRDLMALSLAGHGSILVELGLIDDGMRLIEEATIPVVAGELGPHSTGWIYCVAISASANIADWQRAGEWTEAASRWCDRQAISGFPGVCRVHRAEILRLRGALVDAEEEARAAAAELGEFNLWIAGWAFYELGEIRLRVGDFNAAEEAFRQAHELGRPPQPGLAMVQYRRGKVDAAAHALRRALSDEGLPVMERAKMLPAYVEISIAHGALEPARDAADELADIAREHDAPAMIAAAETAHARVALATGDLSAAEAAAKRAGKLWKQTDFPYDVARICVLLAEIYAAEGDRDGAELELGTARSTFEKLGAVPDAEEAAARLAALSDVAAPVARRVAKTFLFSDIVKSTNLLQAIGDEAWTDLLAWHDETLRTAFAAHGGTEVSHTGDGFFVAFEDADDALRCAVAIQRSLVAHRRSHGFSPQVRIGVHAAEAAEVAGNYHGQGVHEAARIGAVAEGGEILASASTISCISTPMQLSEVRTVNLKGLTERVQVVNVLWRDE